MNIVDLDKLSEMFWDGNFMEIHKDDIPSIPSAFDGMTNGEVIQALFPNGKVIECDEAIGYEQMLDDKYSYCSWFDSLWWNAPYQKGGAE